MYAWLMPASTIVQAVIGGITVLTGCCGGRWPSTCWRR
ncbi:putative membrane protein [Mycobacterium xenopi 3993]|nr:putative membrane protein [Mycobacterium xenopi 3993]